MIVLGLLVIFEGVAFLVAYIDASRDRERKLRGFTKIEQNHMRMT